MDCALFPGPRAFLAAVEPPGTLNSVPIPGKVRILTSTDLTDWTEMDVDYKADRALAGAGGAGCGHQWAGDGHRNDSASGALKQPQRRCFIHR